MDRAQAILKNVFGYDSFRPLQYDIIQNILNKKDTLVIMPTGGGKSICYQIPALIFEGLTIVISPLISLMKDQVEQLHQLGVKTALLNSSLPPDVYNSNYNSVIKKHAKLLYIAPESLFKEEIANLLNNVKLDCITIDEAHCISEWGHDFRPEYRQLGLLRKKFPSAVCTGLTATATQRVRNDIIKNLNMTASKSFIASFNRENLFLQVVPKHDAFEQTVSFLREHPNQSGIIYCFSRKQVDTLYEDLSSLGYSIKPYHAGLSDKERTENQDLFIKDEIQIIAATIAFGMGINKSNVRFIVHYDLPKNIETYYQEIGRSGRDGLRSDCLLLFSYADIAKINYFINQKEDPVEKRSAKAHLNAMIQYAESEICRRITLINYFGEKYNADNCSMCDNCNSEEKDLVDITIPAQKFLSAVKRTGEIFGANYIINILTGKETERMFQYRHQNLSVFGVGRDVTKKQWNLLLQQFLRKELLLRDDEYGSLKLTSKASNVLYKKEKIFGYLAEPEIKLKKSKYEETAYDNELFEILREKRKELADERRIPPYVIFSDKTLIQIAADLPQTKEDFLNISGIGRRKVASYAGIFLPIIRRYCSQKGIKSIEANEKHDHNKNTGLKLRYQVVGESYINNMSVDQLAAELNVKRQTIVDHLFKYVNEGNKIRTDELLKLISLPQQKHKLIFNEFKIALQNSEDNLIRLSTVYEKFEGTVSYEDLHLLRLIYLCKDL